MASPIELPTLLFWANGNTWYGSKGLTRFFLRPVREEDSGHLEAEVWRGPLTRELSQVLYTAAFPLSEEGLSRLTAWLEERAGEMNEE